MKKEIISLFIIGFIAGLTVFLFSQQVLGVTVGSQLDMGGNKIISLGDPVNPNDAATWKYVKDQSSDDDWNIGTTAIDSTYASVSLDTFKQTGNKYYFHVSTVFTEALFADPGLATWAMQAIDEVYAHQTLSTEGYIYAQNQRPEHIQAAVSNGGQISCPDGWFLIEVKVDCYNEFLEWDCSDSTGTCAAPFRKQWYNADYYEKTGPTSGTNGPQDVTQAIQDAQANQGTDNDWLSGKTWWFLDSGAY